MRAILPAHLPDIDSHAQKTPAIMTKGQRLSGSSHAYCVFRATATPSTSLGSAGVCLGNTRRFGRLLEVVAVAEQLPFAERLPEERKSLRADLTTSCQRAQSNPESRSRWRGSSASR